MTTLARSRADLAGVLDDLPGPLGLVPTMGALHAGHAALIAAAREVCESVLVSIFVNPMQFGTGEDLATYPRSLAADVALCEQLGADAVWAPGVADVYPGGEALVQVHPGPLGAELEGAFRPTHFSGVLTVVAKYFSLIRPALGFFGEKDYQQLALVRRMTVDLDLGVAVAGVPTVREDDGLALSSRNVYLAPAERQQALALSRALFAGRDAAGDGAAAVLAAAKAILAAEPGVDVDYLELRDPDLGAPPARGPARLLVAARVGRTRLIDNVEVSL
ncbi:MAG TPA: pantoate--beta-alanine ligase [Jatrophihabitans sp.]|nr:pantoate--beta-alanine ligase [Jatrophihabitans sp.]